MASSPITSWSSGETSDGETMEAVTDFIFLGSKITVNGSHEIKRRLLLGRKTMTNLDSILKSRDITLLTKVHIVKFSSAQSLSHVQLFATPWTAACQASLSITNVRSLLKLISIQSVDGIQPSHPLSSPSPPTFSLSQHQGLFQWVSSSHQVAKVLEFQLQHQSFQWIFRTYFH